MERRKYVNDPDRFRYICGLFTPESIKKPITKAVRVNYKCYLKCPLGDQDKKWAPHTACKSCINHLNEWNNGKRSSALSFAVPMVWRESWDHSNDCYFCLINIKGITVKTRTTIQYPDITSAIRPVPNNDELPVPVPPAEHELIPDSDSGSSRIDDDHQDKH